MLKGLQHCLHQLVLVGDELLNMRVGIISLIVVVAALTVVVIPCVCHVRGF
jgi:hypothetical protein